MMRQQAAKVLKQAYKAMTWMTRSFCLDDGCLAKKCQNYLILIARTFLIAKIHRHEKILVDQGFVPDDVKKSLLVMQ